MHLSGETFNPVTIILNVEGVKIELCGLERFKLVHLISENSPISFIPYN